MNSLIELKNLEVTFGSSSAIVVSGVDLRLLPGQTIGLVGESGSGKSITAHAIMGLLPLLGAEISQGEVRWLGQDITAWPTSRLARHRGRDFAMIFQEPMVGLNPLQTVETQVAEPLVLHKRLSRRQRRQRVLASLAEVGLEPPHDFLRRYPHELSGGQLQRIMIAMALICKPKVLIADEPTTALDALTQQEIIQLLQHLKGRYDLAMLFISHDLTLVAQLADEVAVMRQGRIVEKGSCGQLYRIPEHPYTKILLAARPQWTGEPDHKTSQGHLPSGRIPLLQVCNLRVYYRKAKALPWLQSDATAAVDGVSLEIFSRETLALVGASGSGKSSLARAIAGLQPAKGFVKIGDFEVLGLRQGQRKPFRRLVQYVFQNPQAALDPKMSVGQLLREPLQIHGIANTLEQQQTMMLDVLSDVGLNPKVLSRYPHQLSGGQRQRICLARALLLGPELLILDEAVASLDMSVRGQILQLLQRLQQLHNLTYLFISHDLDVVRQIADRVAIMEGGRIVESGSVANIMEQPKHPYTRRLLDAVPRVDLAVAGQGFAGSHDLVSSPGGQSAADIESTL